MAVANRYGWHRDELYFLEAGRHLEWGYVDQPPFTPFVARVADAVAPGNLAVLRALPALATGLTVALGAVLVRELGGGRRAQVVGAVLVACGGFTLGVGHLLATATFDLLAWMALLAVAVRLLRSGDPRWWVIYGGLSGLAMLNKNLVVLLAASLGAGIVAGGRARLLASRWLALGVTLALALAAPHLVWQAKNGWPQFEMAEVLADRLAVENRTTLVPLQVVFVGPLAVYLLGRGVRWLWRSEVFRPLAVAWPVGLVVCLVSAGRPYYVLPLTFAVALAGVVQTDLERPERSLRLAGRLVAAGGAVSVLLGLPVLPRSVGIETAALNETVAETIGWPELVRQVADTVAALPPGEREDVVLLTGTYGEAGAIDRFGPALGLPRAHSPHNGYADFRRPDDESATVVAVRVSVEWLAPHFESCEQVAAVDNGLDVDNEVQGEPIVVCRGLRASWDETWEDLRFLS